METITVDFDTTAAVTAGQEWIDKDRSHYDTVYPFVYDLGVEVYNAVEVEDAPFKDRKAFALKLNESWGIKDKGAETRCRRAYLVAMAANENMDGVLAYEEWAGEGVTITGLVAWIDNGFAPPAAPVVTPPTKARWNAEKVGATLADEALTLADGDKARAKAALTAALKALG